ncbi:hypothetical protein IMZ31_11545 [Pontibacillus sp. ALD_SL1]|uniref:hypothetical protein n=1 Tax=Pontibacillus sp. ALD_SL1 TaxID=2777185 RepID=UPI001A96FC7A|nr:hypothetical protein [Pontibacillus sp. ALD_SL1]QSS98741.1 hypothetical protein IMZ31_11545 [Pontibacillus sp. ALD_SL1]
MGRKVGPYQRKNRKRIVYLLSLVIIITGGLLYYVYFFTPKNSMELYRQLHFSEDIKKAKELLLEGYEDNLTEEDFKFIANNPVDQISQFTLFKYNEKSYVIMTSPGTERLKILAVKELPEDLREFFLDF